MGAQTWKIHKDDTVMVLAGKDKGKTGKVVRVLRSKNQVVVEQVNVMKKHVKPNPYRNQQGGIVDKEMPLDISNVQLFCPACSKAARVGYRTVEVDGAETGKRKKVRYCKKCNEAIS